jgi:hypothetical protein
MNTDNNSQNDLWEEAYSLLNDGDVRGSILAETLEELHQRFTLIRNSVSSPSPVKEIKGAVLDEIREYLEELANESPRANLLLTKLNGYQD